MKEYFGCDAHKQYSLFGSVNEAGQRGKFVRVEHDRNSLRLFLSKLPPKSPIAVETVGNWYWIIDEMEKAGHIPSLVHAAKAKLMMGQINKTDKLDTEGLALLQRNGTLPSVWIPPAEIRDQRELPRMRMALVGVRTMLKNRIHATLAKYAINITEVSDIFGVRGRELIQQQLVELPPQTRSCVEIQLKMLDQVEEQISLCEEKIGMIIEKTPMMQILMSIPGIGPILATVIALEIEDINRFPDAEHLASYAGTVPRVHSSGGRTFYGRTRPDVNHYLKWAFVEAANVSVLNQNRWLNCHTVQLYKRIKTRKGHAKAVVALARHLAEASYWVIKKNESYREPKVNKSVSSIQK